MALFFIIEILFSHLVQNMEGHFGKSVKGCTFFSLLGSGSNVVERALPKALTSLPLESEEVRKASCIQVRLLAFLCSSSLNFRKSKHLLKNTNMLISV